MLTLRPSSTKTHTPSKGPGSVRMLQLLSKPLKMPFNLWSREPDSGDSLIGAILEHDDDARAGALRELAALDPVWFSGLLCGLPEPAPFHDRSERDAS
mmetsp:Transcript_154584/g.494372  ORF Transcript_154584/g.494372 Transcript_154584/m.494372 type:complete len:98 (-) Transcript_154584:1389-1682(-)